MATKSRLTAPLVPHFALLGLVSLALVACGQATDTPAPAPVDSRDSLTVADSSTAEGDSSAASAIAAMGAEVTPMEQRIARIGIVNKRNGEAAEWDMRPNETIRHETAEIRLRACERTAPWERPPETGAFVQLRVQDSESADWQMVFSGWLFKERPDRNIVEHPLYDIFVKSCAMTFPDTALDTAPVSVPDSVPDADSNSADSATDGVADVIDDILADVEG